ncbi:TolC family outer membrane protein [Sphingomonas sp. MMS24-J45]|uniref:TolC family outer membrane protein n=1 Tax=Sphingomonas sp. MMS24-J45 TaxID=3238806 RepID=UPI00384F7B9A
MRSLPFLTGTALLALSAAPLSAETLREALLEAYKTNPTLAAQRANVRAIDENVPIARSSALPGVQLQSSYTEAVVLPVTAFTAPARTSQTQANLTYSLYAGGATKNGIAAADIRVQGGQAALRGTEADLFSAVVGAYMDVIRDEAIVALNRQNVRVLEVNLRASRDRFQVGDLTRTDVAQSDARSAIARGQLQTAEARLISSRESYIRLVGSAPGVLENPPPLPNLPSDPDTAVSIALADNPNLLAAQKNGEASKYDVKVARAARLPRVDAVAGGSYTNYFGSLGSFSATNVPPQYDRAAQLGLRFTLPLYQGGAPAARIRQAQERRAQALEQVTEAERQVIAQARSAYAVWQSSLQVIASSEVAVNANKLSLEGVRAENSVGNRTILDILNAEQELLNSQVTLVTARRDAYVAGFALLAAMGQAEAKDLGLEAGPLYDPSVNAKRVRNNIWDFAPAPAVPVTSTRTNGTRPQGAQVTRPLDPILDGGVDRSAPITAGEGAPNR